MDKVPLTREDLLVIQETHRGDPTVRALLWEIWRLRAVVLRAHDVARLAESGSTQYGFMSKALKVTLDAEPIVQEQGRQQT